MISLKVHVYVNKEKLTLSIQSEPGQLLQDIFEKIAIKRGLVRRKELYKFLEYTPMTEYGESVKSLLKYKDDLNLKTLGMAMKVGDLKVKEVALMERYFADVPESMPRAVKCSTPQTEAESPHLHKQQQEEWEAQLASDGCDPTCFDALNCGSCEYQV